MICTWLRPSHLSIHVGDGSRHSEVFVTNLKFCLSMWLLLIFLKHTKTTQRKCGHTTSQWLDQQQSGGPTAHWYLHFRDWSFHPMKGNKRATDNGSKLQRSMVCITRASMKNKSGLNAQKSTPIQILPRWGLNPWRCIKQDSEPNTHYQQAIQAPWITDKERAWGKAKNY